MQFARGDHPDESKGDGDGLNDGQSFGAANGMRLRKRIVTIRKTLQIAGKSTCYYRKRQSIFPAVYPA